MTLLSVFYFAFCTVEIAVHLSYLIQQKVHKVDTKSVMQNQNSIKNQQDAVLKLKAEHAIRTIFISFGVTPSAVVNSLTDKGKDIWWIHILAFALHSGRKQDLRAFRNLCVALNYVVFSPFYVFFLTPSLQSLLSTNFITDAMNFLLTLKYSSKSSFL